MKPKAALAALIVLASLLFSAAAGADPVVSQPLPAHPAMMNPCPAC